MALQPLALHLLGVEAPSRRRRGGEDEGRGADGRPSRSSRRATSYYNAFQTTCTTSTDEPPCYAIAARQKPVQRRQQDEGREVLPQYTCTVAAEAKVLLNIESVNPLHDVAPAEWRDVYLVIRGTMLSIHRPKDNRPGRLLRTYTLQHAEVGLAPDVEHVTLEPRTKLAHMVPSVARRRAWMKDPDLFQVVPQHAMRLRLETDQIVLASPDEEQIHQLIYAVSAGIDVSCSIDERNIPKQTTVPRRRRRHRHQQQTNNLEDPTLLAEQERILRDMYPGFAERTDDQLRPPLGRTITTITAGSTVNTANETLPTPAREEDEIDLSAIREEEEEAPAPTTFSPSPRRPHFMRSITDTSINTAFSGDMLYATAPENFNADTGKWQPPHHRTPHQVQRYVKRCLPVLLADATRASEILICNGKRVRVNLRMEMLEAWELLPPSYKSHGFARAVRERGHPTEEVEEGLEEGEEGEEEAAPRSSVAQSSAAPETDAMREEGSAASVLDGEGDGDGDGVDATAADEIRVVDECEHGLANLALSKVASLSAADGKKSATREAARAAKREENREASDAAGEIHGVVFCF